MKTRSILYFVLVFVACLVSSASAFVATSFPLVADWVQPLASFFNNNNQEQQRLKEQLLQLCRNTEENPSRDEIQLLLNQLAPLSPIQSTATSSVLQNQWMLEWTTEKEINFFLQQGFTSPGSIYQSICENEVLENKIPFTRGGFLSVEGQLSRPTNDADSLKQQRTNFYFTRATLDLAKWGTYSLPPLGKGWFDTIYLDDELRIDVNSRDDILICTAAATRKEE